MPSANHRISETVLTFIVFHLFETTPYYSLVVKSQKKKITVHKLVHTIM
jgi:K+-sensing histidine kinase KdpD